MCAGPSISIERLVEVYWRLKERKESERMLSALPSHGSLSRSCSSSSSNKNRWRRWSVRPSHSALAIVLACVCIVLSFSESAEAAAPPSSASSSTVYADLSVCPRCPLCSRVGTSVALRLRYCNGYAPFVMSALRLFSSARANAAARYPKELPFASDADVRKQALQDLRELLTSRVVGQSHVTSTLEEVVRRKLAYPREPIVLHFAGDNGVGKTHTARLLSQALSLRCAADRDVCEAGDNLLLISGTGFDGVSLAQARRRVVRQITRHMRDYPHGIVLIDDLTAMDPALVKALAPLFGRDDYFPEQLVDDYGDGEGVDEAEEDDHYHRDGEEVKRENRPDTPEHAARESRGDRHANKKPSAPSTAPRRQEKPQQWLRHHNSGSHPPPPPPLSQMIVVVTTDFGRQGRTVGKSSQQIEQMVRDEFTDLYGALLPAYTRTFAFLPFQTTIAEAVVRSAVAGLPCTLGEHVVAASAIDDDAVHFLVERHRPAWESKENGHALRRAVEDELVAQVLAFREQHGLDRRVFARFVFDERSVQVVLRTGREPRASDDAQRSGGDL